MKLKRFVAYILDMLIISILSSLIMYIPILKNSYKQYEDYSSQYFETLFSSTSGSADIDEKEVIEITYNMQKASQTLNIITVGLLILYFGVAAYIFEGQTIGKKLLHLKIVPIKGKNLNPGLFILRSIIITNILPRIGVIITTIYCNSTTWFNIISIINNIEYIIMFVIIGFMIFRDDERGLHDIICQTKVIKLDKKDE